MKLFLLATVLVTAMHTTLVRSQTVDPPNVSFNGTSPMCSGSEMIKVCIALPSTSTNNKVDVFFLLDDTGFFRIAPNVSDIFSSLVTGLEAVVPTVDFGFGVARFEDYGGPGRDYSDGRPYERPFILNQPIITAADVGGIANRNSLITEALNRTAPGDGGDLPESAIAEGLFQVATGVGFDGDGDGSTQGLSNLQPAGSVAAQTTPDDSGDVPAFSTKVVSSSGTVGGAGFHDAALKLVILATDYCAVAAFDSTLGLPPVTITGTFGTEPTNGLTCSDALGAIDRRYGYVGDSKAKFFNNITNAVVPSGAATVPQTIAALNAAGIRVLGMGPGVVPIASGSGSSVSPANFLSPLARLTGAVDSTGTELVFSVEEGGNPLKDAMVNAIEKALTAPINIGLRSTTGTVPVGSLSVVISPNVVEDVEPDTQVCFFVTFTGTSGGFSGNLDLVFQDATTNLVLGSIPVTIACPDPPTPAPTSAPTPTPRPTSKTGKTPKPTKPTTAKPTTAKPTNPPKPTTKPVKPVKRSLMDT